MPRAKEFATIILRIDEGWEEEPYYCTEGYPTIGYGFRIPNTNKGDPLPDITMSREEGDTKLAISVDSHYKTLIGHVNTLRAFGALSDIRQAVLISMCHQLGFSGLIKFQKMWAAISAGNFEKAAEEAIDSDAARQTRERRARNSEMIRDGKLHGYYL